MDEPIGGQGSSFGGSWTKEKLDVLEGYLDAYTTALKNQPFERNSTRSVLFEFMFCVGHPKGIGPAKAIAEHLLSKL